MNIFIVSRLRSCRCRRLSLNLAGLLAGLSVLALAAGGLFWAGYQWSARTAIGPDQDAIIEAELLRQRQELDAVSTDARRHLDALSMQIGQLRGGMLRLEALGMRLTDMAGLDESEFDFSAQPAMGGPGDPDALSTSVPDFLQALDELTAQIGDRTTKLQALESLLLNRELQTRIKPAGRPVKKGWLSSHFGKRNDPISGKKVFHEGVDFAGKLGADVVAVADGVVSWSGKRYGYGNLVEVTHGNSHVTRYGHNKENLVKVGDKVVKGQVLAHIGSTGRSTGPHVHFEVIRNGKAVNPLKYIQAEK